ncbi:MAG: histidine phosphatase family protein [Anaerolineaceae bacterium]|nr:histidine phosphatase family protein [Anaerolineaceae bacterium]
MNSYTLVFLRHAESVGNAEGFFQGQKDFPLTPRGGKQVRRLIARWQADGTQIDQVITSPLQRAAGTAEMICQAFNCPLEIDPDWRERNVGRFTGLKREEADLVYPKPEFFTPYDNMGETGEGDWALFLRAGNALQRILRKPPARYVIVSHGGILNQALHVILGMTPQANGQGVHFRFVNTAFATVYYEPEQHRWVIWGLNDFTHLAFKGVDLDEDEES